MVHHYHTTWCHIQDNCILFSHTVYFLCVNCGVLVLIQFGFLKDPGGGDMDDGGGGEMKNSESLNISGNFPAEHDASPKPISRAKEKRVNRCVTVRQPLTEHVNRLVVIWNVSGCIYK